VFLRAKAAIAFSAF